MPSDAIASRYLERYGSTESSRLSGFPAPYKRAVVIPSFAEPVDSLFRLHEPPLSLPGTLTILVLNAPTTSTAGQDAANLRLYEILQRRYRFIWACDNLQLRQTAPDAAVLVIERFHGPRRLPRRAGVGLARRIGCDCALRLFLDDKLEDSLIRTTDADARLADSSFEVEYGEAAAVIYPFIHRMPSDPALALAGQLYELSLHYYVLGLRWAASPYAVHSVGSTLAVQAHAYARVRGFPKRAGGEDFYLLNKLAKIAAIKCLDSPVVELDTRPSQRVPFGTGPAVSRIRTLPEPLDAFLLYHPDSFRFLRAWLACWPELAGVPETSVPEWLGPRLSDACPVPASVISDWARQFEVARAVEHARRHGKSGSAFLRHMHVWFDAFRTLKSVHYLRDTALPSLRLSDAAEAPFLPALDCTRMDDAVDRLRRACWDRSRETGLG